MNVCTCDGCHVELDSSQIIEVGFPVVNDEEDADEDEVDTEWAQFCSFGCLAAWAMENALDLETLTS